MNKRVRTPPPATATNAETQPGLFDGVRPPSPWPDARLFPHNEDGNKVKAQVTGLLAAADDALLITPATDLGSLFGMLTQWTAEKGRPLRLLLGKPPEVPWKGPFRARPGGVGAQIRELWMQKGLDVATMGQAVRVIALLKTKGIEARLFTDDLRAMDARMVVTDEAAIVGSSGLTRSGLEADVQSNIRIEREDTQKYQAARRFAEELWKKGLDWTDELEKLLRALVHLCTWQEALARACALVLDGDWAKKIDGTKPRAPLWPHQEVALSRGLYLLDQCGGLIVADATGSGKTKLGAALFAAALRRRRSRQSRQDDCALAFVPPGVKRDWEVELGQSIGKQQVESHGLLSGSEEADNGVKEAIQGARLLGIDEAHNFLNLSKRTYALRQHLADEVILFTATPINRGALDLLPLIALIGADNLDDAQLEKMKKLLPSRRSKGAFTIAPEDEEALRAVLRQFLIRRTRAHIQRYVNEKPERYQDEGGNALRYPKHTSVEYPLELSAADAQIVQQINAEARKLKGIGWFGAKLELYPAWQADKVSEEQALKRVVKSAAALARYHLIHSLRSSRAALIEHIEGTASAAKFADLVNSSTLTRKENPGQLDKLVAHKLPEWHFTDGLRAQAPRWLIDEAAHAAACAEEAARYNRIVTLVSGLSDGRERQKVDMLAERHRKHKLLLAFDHSLITLELFEKMLRERGAPVEVFSGRGGVGKKQRARRSFKLGSTQSLIGLCTDAFSEGFNLQSASCVVHLDTPTVIRAAVQRSGRVDRLNSPHEEILIAWPKEPELLQPIRGDLLEARRREEHICIGSDVTMPEDEEALVSPEQALKDYQQDLEHGDRLQDGFECVEGLVKGERKLVEDEAIYERMRGAQQAVRCAVSLLPTDEEEWAFFVVAGRKDDPPRWVLLKHGEERPVTDLVAIEDFFQRKLRPGLTTENPLDFFSSMTDQASRLSDMALLSRRRQKALGLLSDVATAVEKRSTAAKTGDAYAVMLHLRAALDEKENIDLRELADRWVQHLRPRWTEHLKNARRLQLPQLSDLKPELKEAPPSLEELSEIFDDCPKVQPIRERLLVAIVAAKPQPG